MIRKPNVGAFKNWMYGIIRMVECSDDKPLWVKIISDSLDEGMRNLGGKMNMFHMTCYVVYAYAFRGTFNGLQTIGKVKSNPGDVNIWEHYPQLKRRESLQHYRRVNDSFSMHLVRTMEEDRAKRLSVEAQAPIYNDGAWFIQLPIFSYIRMEGFTG